MNYKSLNLGPKFSYLGIFMLTFERKTIDKFEVTSNFSKRKVSYKIKNP